MRIHLSRPNWERSRHSKFDRTVEDVARKSSINRLPIRVTRMQPIASTFVVVAGLRGRASGSPTRTDHTLPIVASSEATQTFGS